MAKHSGGLTFLPGLLDRASDVPLYRQLYEAIRAAVLDGRLAPSARLPASRMLARELGLSRNTVTGAYAQLLAEGYLEGRIGAGTSVCRVLPDALLQAATTEAKTVVSRVADAGLVAPFIATSPLRYWNQGRAPIPTAFRSGVPALDAFPVKTWSRLMAKTWRQVPHELLNYGAPAGYYPLREAIAGYLNTARGVRCTTEQVIIVTGSQQGLDLVSRVLLSPGDSVWMEEPGYVGAKACFTAAGANLVPIPVDADGLDVAAGERICPQARMTFVTPSHQYPLGMTMPLPRRLALLDWAARSGAWVVEDDYDSEFRYAGRPLAALQGLDTRGCVLYIGTFSKVMFPALRLGYLVVPPDLVEAFSTMRAMTDQHSPLIEQAVLAEFMTSGLFARHIRHMRALYAERQGVLLDAAHRELGGLVAVAPDNAGMHLMGWLPNGLDDEAVARQAGIHSVDLLPVSRFYMATPPRPGVLLGYAAVAPEEIRAGAVRLRESLMTAR